MGQKKISNLHIVTDIKVNTESSTSHPSCQNRQRELFRSKLQFFKIKKELLEKLQKPEQRFVKNIGLGFKTPREASEGTYIDKKCPFTGNVSIRGRILTGVVQSMKMKRTIVLRRDYLHFIKKYQRYEKRHKTLSAHMSPCFRDVNLGDLVTVSQCRPLSKTVRFNVLKVAKSVAPKSL